MTTPNSSSLRPDPQCTPPYDDRVANSSFNPSGPEPLAPTQSTNPGTSLHSPTRDESPIEEAVEVGSRVDRGRGSPMDVTCDLPQERSRFAFAQERTENTADTSMSRIPAAHAHQSPASQSRTLSPINAIPTTMSRILGPQSFRSQSASHAGREPTLVAPETVHHLPTRLINFEDYEEEPHSDHAEYPPLSMAPPLGSPNSDYTDTDIEVGDWRPEADEHFYNGDEDYFYNGDEDYDPLEFDVNSDFGSESLAPYVVAAFDRPIPYQGQILGGEGCPHASGATSLWFPSHGSPYFPLYGPYAPPFGQLDPRTTQLQDAISWSAFTNPFTGAPITAPSLQPSVTLIPPYHVADDNFIESETDWFLASRHALELTFDPFEGGAEGWYDQSDLTGYAFPVPPQQPESSGGYWV